VLALLEQGENGIWTWLVGHETWRNCTSLHFRPHVRGSGCFVTADLRKTDKCRGSIAIFLHGWHGHPVTNAFDRGRA
jgi:hypothetical protein